jgi:cbb3-type cytochrome oxidase subunit 3
MKDRIKWILVGLGFTFGLQVIISLAYTAIAYSAARGSAVPQDTIVIAAFGFMLGAFLIGGFVVGWMSEEVRVLDSLIVAALTLILTLLVYSALPSGNKGQFVSGYLLANVKRGSMFILLALIASAIGSYWGSHVKVPQEGVLDRVALLVGLVGAVVGPFVLLAVGGSDPTNPNQSNLPWYFLVIVILVVLAIVGVGFVLFTRESHYEEEISISPEHHKEGLPKG